MTLVYDGIKIEDEPLFNDTARDICSVCHDMVDDVGSRGLFLVEGCADN